MWLIDVSQSVEPTHPHGLEFLFRDCRNVSTVNPSPLCWIRKFKPDSRFHSFLFNRLSLQFFQKRGVSEAMSTYDLFNAVTGLNIAVGAEDEAEFMAEVTQMLQVDDPPVIRVV